MSQQIYLPLGGQYSIPYEFEADTMLVPRGQSSVLWELRDGNLTAAQAMIILFLNHGSTWNSGATWSMSGPYLSKKLGGMSRRYVRDTLTHLDTKGWIKTIDENNPSGYQYRLRHYLCDYEDVPVDRDDKPLKFAVPRGAGGPIERCMDGDISWKAALAWISLKLKSNWKASEDTAGQTEAATLLELSKRIRISLPTYQKTHHRTNTSRHVGTADTQIASGDLSVVPQALPETCPTRNRDPTGDSWRESHQNRW